jgi:hypothetical protein
LYKLKVAKIFFFYRIFLSLKGLAKKCVAMRRRSYFTAGQRCLDDPKRTDLTQPHALKKTARIPEHPVGRLRCGVISRACVED